MAEMPHVRQIPRMTMRGDRTPFAISVRIKQIMAVKGMNAATFARHVGWTPQKLNNYLSAVNRISIDEAFKLRVATGVSLDWIYEGDRSALPLSFAKKLPPDSDEPSANAESSTPA